MARAREFVLSDPETASGAMAGDLAQTLKETLDKTSLSKERKAEVFSNLQRRMAGQIGDGASLALTPGDASSRQ